ncbi:MAG: GNAT family N-acetyltransferase [Urechidicola sp.]|nr:GNAT family N-acetyltransferase [Urechidicola sp.]
MNLKINDEVFNDFPVLESERLIFRAYKKSDAPMVFSIRTDKRVMEYMDAIIPTEVKDSEKRIENIQKYFVNKEGITWVIVEKKSNEMIGDIGIWKFDRKNNRGEIGYLLRPEFWRKGYMKEAMNTLIRFGFNELKLHSIEANVNTENENSKQLLLSVGFKLEAHFRENYFFEGKYLDSLIYSLLQSDLKNNEA